MNPDDKEGSKMKDQNYAATKTSEMRLARRSPEYWRLTFDHPPLNIFGPEMLPQVNDVITALETDEQVKVVVFDSAVAAFFLIHLDFLANLDDLARRPPGPTGLHPWPEMLVRLSRAPVVSVALIRGRATGMGSELALACDMRFASREKAILSQFEVGAGGQGGQDFMGKRLALRAILLLVSVNLLYAAIFLKFAGVPGSVALFTRMSQAVHGLVSQPVFRLGSGAFETVLAVLLLIPKTARLGAGSTVVWMTAVILSHILVLGYGWFFLDGLMLMDPAAKSVQFTSEVGGL
jgi:hypothetical protein